MRFHVHKVSFPNFANFEGFYIDVYILALSFALTHSKAACLANTPSNSFGLGMPLCGQEKLAQRLDTD